MFCTQKPTRMTRKKQNKRIQSMDIHGSLDLKAPNPGSAGNASRTYFSHRTVAAWYESEWPPQHRGGDLARIIWRSTWNILKWETKWKAVGIRRVFNKRKLWEVPVSCSLHSIPNWEIICEYDPPDLFNSEFCTDEVTWTKYSESDVLVELSQLSRMTWETCTFS